MHATMVYVYKQNERTDTVFLFSYIVILLIFFFAVFFFVSHWLLQHARLHVQTNETHTHTREDTTAKTKQNFYNCTRKEKKESK